MLQDKRVMVTGGHGFLGTHVVKELQEQGAKVSFPSHKEFDLRRRLDVERAYLSLRPQIVIHLAGNVGGIGYNSENPGRLLYDNLIMGLEMIDVAKDFGVQKYVQLGTVCAYPKFTPVPFKEDDLWNGFPEETNAPYGVAKKALLLQCQGYRQQYGLNAIYLLPVNLYGPGDHFDPKVSHVIPALIKKFIDARNNGDNTVNVWGTGQASREFLYVEDCAKAIVLATRFYNKPEPINVGTGKEITIADLVEVIRKATGFEGEVQWDHSKPDGQPRRCLDTSRAAAELGFRSQTDFEEGIKRTTEWYEAYIDCHKQLPVL